MLEVIINQNDKQIGQLQFDSNWRFEDAMNVLGIYVAREVPREKGKNPGEKSDRESPKDKFDDGSSSVDEDESSLVLNDVSEEREGENLEEVSYQSNGVEFSKPPLDTDAYKILDRYATGKKRVMSYKENNVTGNYVAILIALKMVGGAINAANDLEDVLKKDARYDSRYDSGTYRQVLRALTELGFVEKREGDVRVITDLGRQVAALFTVLPKVENAS